MKLGIRFISYSLINACLSIGIMMSSGFAKNLTPYTKKDNHKTAISSSDDTVVSHSNADDGVTNNMAGIYPTVDKIIFTGNTKISSQDLLNAIPLKIHQVANEETITNSLVKIGSLYKAKNIKITITPLLQKKDDGSTNIQFDIHEHND